MQRKKMIGAGITLFAVVLGILWLIPLIWLIGTAFSVPSFHMTLFPTTPFTLDNLKVRVERDSLRHLLPEYADSGGLHLRRAVRHFHPGGVRPGRYGFQGLIHRVRGDFHADYHPQ